jgi:hypothetical protein
MTLLKQPTKEHKKRHKITVGGDEITIIHVGHEISEQNWHVFKENVKAHFGDEQSKSKALRILINCINLGVINFKKIEQELEKEAEKSKDVIYI